MNDNSAVTAICARLTDAELLRLAAQKHVQAQKQALLYAEVCNLKYAFTRTMLDAVLTTNLSADEKLDLINDLRRQTIDALTALVPNVWHGEDGMMVTFAIGEVSVTAEETKKIIQQAAQDKAMMWGSFSLYPRTTPRPVRSGKKSIRKETVRR